MASVNPLSRELVFKIVYYGPGLGGKTTTLEHIHATAKPDHRGKLVSLATPVDRTLYFDFLPMRLPPIRGMHVRLQLFTVPGQVYFNATRKLVLTGADGVVFVADAQTARADANLESLDNLRDNLADQGRNLNDVPIVFQYNKYDLPDVLSVDELDKLLNKWKAPSLSTSARTGLGVYEGLERITHTVLASFETQMPESVRVAAAANFDPQEEGLAAALRGASQSEDRAPTSAAIFNRIASSRVTVGSIPSETGADDAPPIDKAAMRAASLPVTSFPETPDDGWGSKEKLAISPAADPSIMTKADSVRGHMVRGSEPRSGESPRSRTRPSVLPPKPFASVIPQAAPQRAYAPAAPPNATTSAARGTASYAAPVAHAPAPPPNATTTAAKEPAPHVAQGAPAAPVNATLSAAKPADAAVDKAPTTEKTVAAPVKATPAAPVRAEVVPSKPEPAKSPVEVVLAKPAPTPVKIEVASAKPTPVGSKIEPAPVKMESPAIKVETIAAKATPAELKITTAAAKPEPVAAKIESVPAKPAPAEPKIEPAPSKSEPITAKAEAIPAKPAPVEAKIESAPAKPEPSKAEQAQAKAAPDKPATPAPATETKAPAPFERLDPTQLFSIADLLAPELTQLASTDPLPTTKAPTIPPATPRAGSVPPGKHLGLESEAALKIEAHKPFELEPLARRTPSAPPPPTNAVALLTAKSDSVPPPPPPPPARTTGVMHALSKETPATNLAPAVGLSFADLWPASERALVHDVEAAIAAGRCSDAITLADILVTHLLTSTATLFGSSDASRDATNMPLLLGLDGRRYLAFRSLVHASRSGAKASPQDALVAYAFAIEARMAKSSIR